MEDVSQQLRTHAWPFEVAAPDWEPLLRAIGDARYVLLGESSHGTHEFYALRAALTQRLIQERGFSMVAVEGDWPDAYRVDRYLQTGEGARDAGDSLAGFRRFPSWMWRNQVVLSWLEWLRAENQTRAGRQAPVGFCGIDLYSLHSSIHEVLVHLQRVAPDAVFEARERYGCFDTFGEDPQRYGYTTSRGYLPSCEEEVVHQLGELCRRRALAAHDQTIGQRDALFLAEQNARVVKNAEHYYRAMYRGGVSSWNLRDTHMADTIDALTQHLEQTARSAKVIIWAHNSHLGDARATELSRDGQLNLGQLLRERHPGETFSLGFSTYEGEVTAASGWDQPAERKRVRPGLDGSHEQLLHEVGLASCLLLLREPALARLLDVPRLQRAIGVIYRPETERVSHYYQVTLARQFDALLHIDRTSALEPLVEQGRHEADDDELPETFPSGL